MDHPRSFPSKATSSGDWPQTSNHMRYTQQFFALGVILGMVGLTSDALAQGSDGSLTCGGYQAIQVQYLGLKNNVIEYPVKDKFLSRFTTIRILLSTGEAGRIDKFGWRVGGKGSHFSICLDGQDRGGYYTSVKMSDTGNRTLLVQVDTSSADAIKIILIHITPSCLSAAMAE